MIADCPKVGRMHPCPWASQGFRGVGDDDRKQAEEGEARPRPHVLVGSLHDTTDRWKKESCYWQRVEEETSLRRICDGGLLFWLLADDISHGHWA